MRQHQAVLAWAGCAKEIMQFVEKISDGLVCELLYLCALDGMPIAELERIYSLPAKDRKEKAAEIWKERQRFLQRIYGKNAEIEQHIVKLHQEINQMFKNSEKKQREMENCMTEIRNLCKVCQERQDESGTSVFEDNKALLEETEEKLREVEGKLDSLQKEYDSLQEENRQWKEHVTEEAKKEKISAEGNKETAVQISFRGLFERMRRKSESKKFISDYLSNKEYSKEQKDYLLRCLESGDKIREIKKFASPRLTIPMMERLRNLNRKSSICQRKEG